MNRIHLAEEHFRPAFAQEESALRFPAAPAPVDWIRLAERGLRLPVSGQAWPGITPTPSYRRGGGGAAARIGRCGLGADQPHPVRRRPCVGLAGPACASRGVALERWPEAAVGREDQAHGTSAAGQAIRDLITVNGVRVVSEDGTWGLVRASSNKPELVVVVESPVSEARMRAMFEAVDGVLRENPEVGAYNQTI